MYTPAHPKYAFVVLTKLTVFDRDSNVISQDDGNELVSCHTHPTPSSPGICKRISNMVTTGLLLGLPGDENCNELRSHSSSDNAAADGCASAQVVKGDEGEHDIMADLVASQEGGEGRKLLGLKKLKKKLKKEFDKWKSKINSVEKKFKEASKKLKKALDEVKGLKSDVGTLIRSSSADALANTDSLPCHMPSAHRQPASPSGRALPLVHDACRSLRPLARSPSTLERLQI